MPCDHYYLERMFKAITRRSAAADVPPLLTHPVDPDHTVAQGHGADAVVVALAVARLVDLGQCATQEAVSRIAGMSQSTAGRNLNQHVRIGSAGLVELVADCRHGDAAHRRANHYRPAV